MELSLYIIEGEQKCWKCGNYTRIIGLGIGEYVHIFGEPDAVDFEIAEDYVDLGEEVHSAWTSDEREIPPKLLYVLQIIAIDAVPFRAIGLYLMNQIVCCLLV